MVTQTGEGRWAERTARRLLLLASSDLIHCSEGYRHSVMEMGERMNMDVESVCLSVRPSVHLST
jgi:hypothetical protein